VGFRPQITQIEHRIPEWSHHEFVPFRFDVLENAKQNTNAQPERAPGLSKQTSERPGHPPRLLLLTSEEETA
jgi:hypothetical protein